MEYKNKKNLLIFYIVSTLISQILYFINIGISFYSVKNIIMSSGFIIFFLVSIALFLILHYQNWKFIIIVSNKLNSSTTIETPGKAIGYLFVPFVNVYWIFKSFGEIGININLIIDRIKIKKKFPNPICIILSIIIFIGLNIFYLSFLLYFRISLFYILDFFISYLLYMISPVFIIFMIMITKKLNDISKNIALSSSNPV